MRIRTKLVLAFLLLAVLPLAAIVLVNYLSSIRVFRQAVEEEVSAEAMELNDRMEEAKQTLGRQIRALGSMSLGMEDEEILVGESRLSELEDLAPMVESVEVIPMLPEPVAAPSHLPSPDPNAAPDLPESFVIYLDRVLEAVEAEGTEEVLTEETMAATEEFLRELGEGIGVHAQRIAAEAERVNEELEQSEQDVVELTDALRDPSLSRQERTEISEERRRAARALREAARNKERLEQAEVEALQEGWDAAKRLFGSSVDWRIQREGKVVGEVRAQISPQNLLGSILGRARREQGEIPFAVDAEGTVYTAEPADQSALSELSLDQMRPEGDAPRVALQKGWLMVATSDPSSEVVLGIARPIGESLTAMRQNAVRNFGFGLGVVILAMVGILPLSGRMTRNIRELSESVDRLADGDTDVAADVASRDEIGQLARNFNRMASDLHEQQRKLVGEVQLREEQETRERLLAAENARKTKELEDARKFQLSLLPNSLPNHDDLLVEVHMETATEVGGDYYDFVSESDGTLTTAIGDATGHGATAGTMVTAFKSLFTASARDSALSEFLENSSSTIKRMNLGRMAMALTLVRYRDDEITVAAAGMPPPLLWRSARDAVEEIEVTGLPLGGLSDSTYQETHRHIEPGDALLLMSDGFPELPNPAGDPLGYKTVRKIFSDVAHKEPGEVIQELVQAAEIWRGERPLLDDITFVLLKRRT